MSHANISQTLENTVRNLAPLAFPHQCAFVNNLLLFAGGGFPSLFAALFNATQQQLVLNHEHSNPHVLEGDWAT